MIPDAPKTPQTPQRKPEGASRGVFGYPVLPARKLWFWREASQFSILAFLAAVAVLAIVVTYLTGWVSDWSGGVKAPRDKVAEVVEPPAPVVPTHVRLIDGVSVPETEPAVTHYYAATIDNHPDARPQSGTDKASVVYEAPVEGGITRLMAVFPDDVVVEKIGPVRSARPYFLDWLAEYDALYAHVGGSPEALDDIKAYGTRDMNEFFQGSSFWRAKDRSAPHNTYTSTELLGKNFERRFGDEEATDLAAWPFKTEAPESERPDAQKVSILYGDAFTVVWNYDAKTNSYARSQGGRVIKTLEGEPIIAKDILVQFASVKTIDSYGRRKIGTVGSGDAVAILDGLAVHGTWKKDTRTGRTRFFDASRNEIKLNPGQIWVEVVPTEVDVKEE